MKALLKFHIRAIRAFYEFLIIEVFFFKLPLFDCVNTFHIINEFTLGLFEFIVYMPEKHIST